MIYDMIYDRWSLSIKSETCSNYAYIYHPVFDIIVITTYRTAPHHNTTQ